MKSQLLAKEGDQSERHRKWEKKKISLTVVPFVNVGVSRLASGIVPRSLCATTSLWSLVRLVGSGLLFSGRKNVQIDS